jgi:hypothetical protein
MSTVAIISCPAPFERLEYGQSFPFNFSRLAEKVSVTVTETARNSAEPNFPK